jgi:hypothetical protein
MNVECKPHRLKVNRPDFSGIFFSWTIYSVAADCMVHAVHHCLAGTILSQSLLRLS